MSGINDMMKRLEQLNIMQVAADSIEDTRTELLEHQQKQLFAGRNKTEREIKPFYKPSTKAAKSKKGQPTDRVTLKDTGAFYNAMFVDVRDTTFVVDSADRKAPWLVDKYGDSIFGLGGIFKIAYLNDLRPVFNQKIEDITGLKFGT